MDNNRTISYDPLWKKIIDVKLTKIKLANKAGVGKGSITRMGKDEPVGLDIIQKICNVLGCDIANVVPITTH